MSGFHPVRHGKLTARRKSSDVAEWATTRHYRFRKEEGPTESNKLQTKGGKNTKGIRFLHD
jgi:hypothetical protein